MPVSYTNRKGQTYTLYQGQTRTGKPRYYFARTAQTQAEPVKEIPPGFTISESINGVVSLAKERPAQIQPEELAAVETEVQRHPESHRYRVAVKHDHIEVYEQVGPDYEDILSIIRPFGMSRPGITEQLRADQERYAQYMPVFRFTLLDPTKRIFTVERMCYRSSIDGWLKLWETGPLTRLAPKLIPTLGTDEFYELF